MKKIISVFVICTLLITGAYILRQQNFNISKNIKDFSNQIKSLFKKESVEFSNNIKVNKLQREISDHRYNNLTDTQKIIYSSIVNAVKNLETEVKIDNYTYVDEDTTTLDVSEAIQAFFDDHPEVFYLNSTYSLYISNKLVYKTLNLSLTYSVENLEALEKEINAIEQIVNRYIETAKNSKGNFEKEVILHNELGQDVTYYSYENIKKIPDLYHSIKGTFIKKSAVCDGIAKALQILYDRIGLETILVSGTLEGEPHAWVLVNINNNWYHVDLTSNKLIKQKYDGKNVVVHTYFNITDEKIKGSHTIDNKNYPKATSEALDYYKMTNSYIYLIDDFNTALKKIINNQSSSNILEFATDRGDDIPSKMSKVLVEINLNNLKTNGVSTVNYYNILNTFVLLK